MRRCLVVVFVALLGCSDAAGPSFGIDLPAAYDGRLYLLQDTWHGPACEGHGSIRVLSVEGDSVFGTWRVGENYLWPPPDVNLGDPNRHWCERGAYPFPSKGIFRGLWTTRDSLRVSFETVESANGNELVPSSWIYGMRISDEVLELNDQHAGDHGYRLAFQGIRAR